MRFLGKLPHVRRPALLALPLAFLLPVAAVAPTEKLGTITSGKVKESSSLAVSFKDDGYAYTVNDDEEGNQLIVHTIRINSGKVVKSTIVTNGQGIDPEAMAIDGKGRLWIADTGSERDWEFEPPTLYRINEPLTLTTDTVKAYVYPLHYPGDAQYNVETLLINPKSGKFSLIHKAETDSDQNRRLQIDPATLVRDMPNEVKVKEVLPEITGKVSDGAFTPNGKWAVLRNGGQTAYVYDPAQSPWAYHAKVKDLPAMYKPESLSFYPDGKRFLIGSEGDPSKDWDSPLYRVGFNQTTGKAS